MFQPGDVVKFEPKNLDPDYWDTLSEEKDGRLMEN